jgi:hypothetical protein
MTNNSFDQISFYLQTTVDILQKLKASVGNYNSTSFHKPVLI